MQEKAHHYTDSFSLLHPTPWPSSIRLFAATTWDDNGPNSIHATVRSICPAAQATINTDVITPPAAMSSSSQSDDGHSTAMTSAAAHDDNDEDDESPSRCTATSTATATITGTATVYAAPSVTLLELVAHTASASALPDSFEAVVSRRGGVVALWAASTLWLVQTGQLPRLWARTLQVRRKPVAVEVSDDGKLLAVLARPAQVDVYELGAGITKRRTIALVHEASSLALSPDARILIAGNQLGIEAVAIGPGVSDTARRTLSGPPGDALEFADDGRTLLITSTTPSSDGTTALFVLPSLYDAPLTDDGEPLTEPPETAWTASVLFPEPARRARCATLLPDPATGTVNELLAWNGPEHAWGIYDLAYQRFTSRTLLLPARGDETPSDFAHDALPAVSPNADLAAVALGLHGTTAICVYSLPRYDHPQREKGPHDAPVPPCFCIPVPNDNIATEREITVLRWVRLDAHVQRLVAIGNSSALPTTSDVLGASPGAKALLIVLDFDSRQPAGSPTAGLVKTEYDLDPLFPGETLPEGSIDFDREVELVRTRTQAQRRTQEGDATVSKHPRRTAARPQHRPRLPSGDSEELTPEEAQALFEAPYDNQQPRSQMSLARAATVAATSPANRNHLRALPLRPLDYRRADGHRQIPHESDADNWVPPPPAYTATADAAGSVSLSHPDAPPIPRFSRAVNRPSIPPVLADPDMSATINPAQLSPSLPYQALHPSTSSNHHPTLSEWEQERRPSLLHPSIFSTPQSQSQSQTSSVSRRRSSATRSPSPFMASVAAPVPDLAEGPDLFSRRRPALGQRRGVESSREIGTSHMSMSHGRSGSAPPLPAAAGTPVSNSTVATSYCRHDGLPDASPQPQYQFQHQTILPRTQSYSNTPSRPSHALRTSPFTRSQPHLLLSGSSSSRLESGRENMEGGAARAKKKKVGCVVM